MRRMRVMKRKPERVCNVCMYCNEGCDEMYAISL